MEIELEDLVINVFSHPPGEPNSHYISFDTYNLKQLFESLLIIFTNGMKLLFGNQSGIVELDKLTEEDIKKVNEYFISMNYEVVLAVFPSVTDYVFKHPNYFKDQKHIKNDTVLKDFYYEVYGKENCAFRISFDNII